MAGVFVVRGKTFENRAELRKAGCRWDPARKAWVICGANMRRDPYHGDKPKFSAVRRMIQSGELHGCRIEWER